MPQIDLKLSTRPGRVLAHVAGDLDFLTAAGLARLDALAGVRELVVDLRDVGFLDCEGARALGQLRDRIEEGGGRLLLSGTDESVDHLLERCGEADAFDRTVAVPSGRFARPGASPNTSASSS